MKREPSSRPGLEISAVILAGGASSRMGSDKAWLEFEGTPLIRLAVEKVRALGVAEVFISGRAGQDFAALQCPVLADVTPGFGPMGGIERGLHACASPLLLVLAVDLPHMTSAFLKTLCQQCDQLTGVVPKLDGQLEPLAAIYPKRCHALALEALTQARRAAREFAKAALEEDAVRVFTVSPSERRLFANWNTPADVCEGRPQ